MTRTEVATNATAPKYTIGYGKSEIEPKIAPLVDAVHKAGFTTFASCEGHIDDLSDETLPRFATVSFYAHEDEAKHVHEVFLNYRHQLSCSWCFRGGFFLHRETNQFVLGWAVENCGVIEQAESTDFIASTMEAGWNKDIPLLIRMFADIGNHKPNS